MLRAAHSFDFGTEFRSYRHNRYNISTVMSGSFQFDQTYTRGPLDNAAASPFGQGMASFLLGISNTNSYVERRSDFAEQSTASRQSSECGVRNAECGLKMAIQSPFRTECPLSFRTPHSAFRIMMLSSISPV